MIPAATADMKILCPACPKGQAATVIAVTAEDESVRCPVCASALKVTTRFVRETRPHSIDAIRTRHELHTVEDESGRVRPRVFEAQPGLRLRGGTWVTFVRHGHKLVGVADRSQSMWNPLVALPSRMPGLDRACQLLLAVCALIAVAYTAVWATQVADFASTSPARDRRAGRGAAARGGAVDPVDDPHRVRRGPGPQADRPALPPRLAPPPPAVLG